MTEQQAWPIESLSAVDDDGDYRVVLKVVPGALYMTADELAAAGITPPAVPDTYPFGDPDGPDCPKMVRETLCVAQGVVGRWVIDDRRDEHVARIGRLIDICDRHRPLGPNGKHRTAHCTPTCGCEDKRDVQDVASAAPDKLTALHALGLTDDDIAYAAEKWVDGAWLIDGTNKRLTVAIGTAAREVTP